MKTLTRVILWIAGVLTAVGVLCILIACGMGFNTDAFQNMIREGKLSFEFGDEFVWEFGNSKVEVSNSDEVNYTEIDEISNLEIEYGAGEFIIRYEETDKISIKTHNVVGFESTVKNGTLIVKGDLSVKVNDDSVLTIILPEGFALDSVDLELGASAATITGLKADSLEIQIGAGEATFEKAYISKLNAEVGVGELNLEIVGNEEDYSYKLECGIGEIYFNGSSHSGIGASSNVTRTDATGYLEIECGIGEVKVEFSK